jgi:methyl-accepting chemotaxis protein
MALTQYYSNLSIGIKLATGFVLLIAIAVVIGLLGLFTINSYGDRSEIVTQASSIESALLEARTEEKNFLLRSSEDAITAAQAFNTQAASQAEALESELVVPADLERLAIIRNGSIRYSELLKELSDLITERDEAIAAVEHQARILTGRISSEDSLYGANAALSEMRRHERNYLINDDDKARESFGRVAERAIRSVNSSFLESETKEEVTTLFENYQNAFDTAVSRIRATSLMEGQMVEAARASLKAAIDLQEVQVQRMAAEREQANLFILLALVVAAAAGGLLAWALARSIVRPIREAVDVATRVASGDLTVQVNSGRGDELGQLLAALGTMIAGLRDLVERINNGATNIASSAEQLSTVTEQTSSGVRQQKDQTDQVATAMNQMVATVNEVAHSAGEAFEAANRASDKSRLGEASVEETLSYVTRLSTEVEDTMERLRGLQADTQNIGSVLDVIKSVADQTNLLALNAAIEAARAGEQGRGFAVVADEVRSLAQRTQSSATEIETLITNLVSSAESSVKTMESGTVLAGQTLDKARNTGEAIKEIATAVEEIKQYNSQIATAAEQQTSVAEDINQNVTLIRDVSDQSATSAGQVASASNELSQLSEDLKQQISRFQV